MNLNCYVSSEVLLENGINYQYLLSSLSVQCMNNMIMYRYANFAKSNLLLITFQDLLIIIATMCSIPECNIMPMYIVDIYVALTHSWVVKQWWSLVTSSPGATLYKFMNYLMIDMCHVNTTHVTAPCVSVCISLHSGPYTVHLSAYSYTLAILPEYIADPHYNLSYNMQPSCAQYACTFAYK